ncbi:MAG: hypothetical protein O3B41_10820 [Bacteroidetes bacterium]|nr:hypothetical protein [Bacteroidota bacterium]
MQAISNISSTSFTFLLARYMRGQIAESAWKKLMLAFDSEGVTSPERMAYARFMNEMLSERARQSLDIPVADEMTGLLKDTRA